MFAAGELFPHDIDLPATRLIGRLGRVQHDALVLHDGVVSFLLDAVLLLLESGRLASLDVLLTLLQLVLRLPNLLLDDDELALLVLEALGEAVDLLLQAYVLRLVVALIRNVTLAHALVARLVHYLKY